MVLSLTFYALSNLLRGKLNLGGVGVLGEDNFGEGIGQPGVVRCMKTTCLIHVSTKFELLPI